MKVVHFSTTDYGGAYKAAARISESMRRCGVDSSLIVRTKTRKDTAGTEVFSNLAQKFVSKAKNLFNLALSEGEVISDYFGTDVSKHPLVREADVVVLHWVNSFVSYRSVEHLIGTGKPLVWVMHDMWLFTGGCHIDGYCGGYGHDCGNCPYLRHRKENDISRRNFLRKVAMLDKGRITLVGPSRWIADCAGKSRITGGQKIVRIANSVDTALYRHLGNKRELRNKYGIDTDKKVILYGAMQVFGNQNKGSAYVLETFRKLTGEGYELVLFGDKPENADIGDCSNIHFAGFVSGEEKLAELYNVADVVVVASRQENYPNTILEAAACATPVAAFRVGGIPEIVTHKETGYLADHGNVDDLASGIRYCADNSATLGFKARQHVEENNRYDVVGEMYKLMCQRCVEKNEPL